MKANTLFAVLVLLAIAALLIGCGADDYQNTDSFPARSDELPEFQWLLPYTAYNVHDLGNGWLTFDFEGYRYLMSPTGGVAAHEFRVGGGQPAPL